MRMKAILLISLLLPASPALAQGQSEDTSKDRQAIEQRVQQYFDGLTSHNAESLRKAFHPDARWFFASRKKLQFEKTLQQRINIATRMAKDSALHPTSPIAATTRILAIDITGDNAFVKAEAEYPLAIITEYLIFMRFEGDWKIAGGTISGKQKRLGNE